MTLPGTYAGLSALTWGKPASYSHLGFSCPFVVSFFPGGGLLDLACFLVFLFSPHSLWCPFLFGVGVLPLFFCFLQVFVVFFFFIMNRLFKRTVVLDGSGFAETVKVEDIVSKIVEFFGSENVLSVQFMPGLAIRVTFENESFAATIVRESSVSIDNVVCHVRGGGPRPENVLVFRYPFEADSAPLREELSKYGEVHDIRFRALTHLDNVMDGARVVRMTRSGPSLALFMLTIIFVRPGTGECLFLVIFVRGLIWPRIARLKGSVYVAVKKAICSVIVQMPQMPWVRWVVVQVRALLILLPLRHSRLLPPRSPPRLCFPKLVLPLILFPPRRLLLSNFATRAYPPSPLPPSPNPY